MSKGASDRAFNNYLMLFVAVPLVLAWLTFACYVIYMGINDDSGTVSQDLDFYVSLIAIIGGPALLFINSILETWKAEQVAELNVLPSRLELDIEKARAESGHAMELAKAEMTHRQMLEERAQAHAHGNEMPKVPAKKGGK
jgi:hypothetical protein|tara:strand:- start:15 stop:437 length:423 start_codon:yes stop_codon:yes gene_type:complete